jgi:hypothetical protein
MTLFRQAACLLLAGVSAYHEQFVANAVFIAAMLIIGQIGDRK